MFIPVSLGSLPLGGEYPKSGSRPYDLIPFARKSARCRLELLLHGRISRPSRPLLGV